MTDIRYKHEILYPLGVTLVEDEATILVRAEGEAVKLLLYPVGEEQACESIAFKKEDRMGNVWSMKLKGRAWEKLEYAFEVDGKPMADPCARVLTGREVWGDLQRKETLRARFLTEAFDWGDDRRPEIPYSEMILYRLHVRGFTRHASSKVKAKGTFAGVREKIPYLKELGITSVELLPVTEFDEVMMAESRPGLPGTGPRTGAGQKNGVGPMNNAGAANGAVPMTNAGAAAGVGPMTGAGPRLVPSGVINYWGYGPSYLFALKAAYGSGRKVSAETEFKQLVKELHQEGMECLVEMYFTGQEPKNQAADVLRYWVQEYHVDGFRLSGFAPVGLLGEDPFLKGTKLLADNWGEVLNGRPAQGYVAPGEGKASVWEKNLAEYNCRFQDDMRRFLKGDEGMVPALMFRARWNPADFGVINYMANTNGFTMMDMVSYDRKHNENNGEDNRDGNDYNHSWNCGLEGPTKKKKIVKLRRQQLRNAFLLLFLSQGTPLLLAGDEFGNSQDGNNNAYCQDNEISWLNWRQLSANADIYEFVKSLIAFRKRHPVFHMDREPRMMDYKSCGRPDMSYHGENAWKPDSESFRRQLGILYWGPYAKKEDGSEDDTFYVAYNMHWEPHRFGLPHLPKGQLWHVVYDTSKEGADGYYPEGSEPVLENQMQAELPGRCIMVFCSKRGSGYYTYDTQVGEVTICCKDEAVSGLHFGRFVPRERDMKEVRTALSDKAFEQLTEYLEGRRKNFDLPLRMEGTEFQKKVWEALLSIPYGETRSYKEIAAQIGDEKSSRAVGMANNKNPIAIVVPCHRVVGADGSLTGYAGGLDVKKRLLELEGAVSAVSEA